MGRTSAVLCVSMPPALERDMDRVAATERRSRSELVREAVRQYVLLARWRRLRKLASLEAVRRGLEPGDVERVVDEVRGARRR